MMSVREAIREAMTELPALVDRIIHPPESPFFFLVLLRDKTLWRVYYPRMTRDGYVAEVELQLGPREMISDRARATRSA